MRRAYNHTKNIWIEFLGFFAVYKRLLDLRLSPKDIVITLMYLIVGGGQLQKLVGKLTKYLKKGGIIIKRWGWKMLNIFYTGVSVINVSFLILLLNFITLYYFETLKYEYLIFC